MRVRNSWLILSLLLLALLVAACADGAAEREAASPEAAPAAPLPARADSAVAALARQDFAALAALVHPTHGVRFTPYAYVDTTADVVLSRQQVARLAADTTVYEWGAYDGTGEPITLPFEAYFERFIYNKPYQKARRGAPDERMGAGNTLSNIKEAYAGTETAFVEYHVPGSDEYGGMDWGSLRLVFERHDGAWYLVGIIHDEWTI